MARIKINFLWLIIVFAAVFMTSILLPKLQVGCGEDGVPIIGLCRSSWQNILSVFLKNIGYFGVTITLSFFLVLRQSSGKLGLIKRFILSFICVWIISDFLFIMDDVITMGWVYYWGSITGKYNPAHLKLTEYGVLALWAVAIVVFTMIVASLARKRKNRTIQKSGSSASS